MPALMQAFFLTEANVPAKAIELGTLVCMGQKLCIISHDTSKGAAHTVVAGLV